MSEWAVRPPHPDLWLLSRAVTDLDDQAAAGQDITDMIARYIDPDAAVYMARERAKHALLLGGSDSLALLGTAWMDGLIAGMMAQHLKNQPQPGGEDDERAGPS